MDIIYANTQSRSNEVVSQSRSGGVTVEDDIGIVNIYPLLFQQISKTGSGFQRNYFVTPPDRDWETLL